MNQHFDLKTDWLLRQRLGSLFVLLALLPGLLSGCGKSSRSVEAPVPEVGVLTVKIAPIPLDLDYTAHTRGIREIEVRARVSGILLKRYYREGQFVKAGELLFKIDPAPFAAQVEHARSQLGVARAQLDEAVLQRDRLASLLSDQAVAEYDYNVAMTRFEAARASMVAAQASLKRAQLDLEYTEVRAPISGFTSCEVRSEGSLVEAGAASSLLTTIAQNDRLYVLFSMPEDEARRVRSALAAAPDRVHARLIAGGGEVADRARIEFIDSRVAADTATVDVRAIFENKTESRTDPNLCLAPGQFVRVVIEGVSSAPAAHIPLRAVMFGADGPFVWTLDPKDVVKFRPVRLGANHGNLVAIEQGVAAGDRVVTDGILKVQPEMVVKPVALAPAESVESPVGEKP